MQTLRFSLSCGGIRLEKEMRVSFSTPKPDWRVCFRKSRQGGVVEAKVMRISAYPETDIVLVECETYLRGICLLVFHDMGWNMQTPQAFAECKEAQAEMRKIALEVQQE